MEHMKKEESTKIHLKEVEVVTGEEGERNVLQVCWSKQFVKESWAIVWALCICGCAIVWLLFNRRLRSCFFYLKHCSFTG